MTMTDTPPTGRRTAAPDTTPEAPTTPPLPDELVAAMLRWYQENRRDLPWRNPDLLRVKQTLLPLS